MNRASRWTLVAILAVACAAPVAALRADDAVDPALESLVLEEAAAQRATGIVVTVRRGKEGLEVEARHRLQASRESAWRVLTDYDGIDRFVTSVKESRVLERGEGFVLVDQVAVGRLFLFSRKLRARLRVHEEPPARIRFEDVLHKDFVRYQGEWRIEESEAGTEIVYRVGTRPAFAVPDFVVREMLRRTVHDLIAQVGAEIERREAVASR